MLYVQRHHKRASIKHRYIFSFKLTLIVYVFDFIHYHITRNTHYVESDLITFTLTFFLVSLTKIYYLFLFIYLSLLFFCSLFCLTSILRIVIGIIMKGINIISVSLFLYFSKSFFLLSFSFNKVQF